jgi:pSer/pThr/pTyr-binding forkhead associated (FHA) protein
MPLMSSGAVEPPVISPYRGVLPFRYADHLFFFGREKIIEDLYAKILLYRLVILFGATGAGKSSVINAGIIPALKNEGCQAERLRVSPEYENAPILIERIVGDAGTPETFLPSIFLVGQTNTTKALERIPYAVEEFFNAIRSVPRGTIPLLIFDQFEELFTLFSPRGDGKDTLKILAQKQVLETIYELAYDEELEVRILIIIRDDFLGELEIFSRRYPQIFDHRVRLEHLDITDAKRAIVGPFIRSDSFGSKISESLADAIVEELSCYEGQDAVSATQLQIVCERLWQKYSSTRPEITAKEFEAEGKVKGLLEGYLTSELEKLGASHGPQAIQILANLITDSDTRDIVSEDKLKHLLSSQNSERMETLGSTVKILEDRRIINRTTQRGISFYEVASEYLITPIKREKQRLLYDYTRRRLRNWWLKVLAGLLIVLSTPTIWAYTVWRANQPWGYLTNLSSGKISELKGEVIYIGRPTAATENLKNQILINPKGPTDMQLVGMKDRTISRVHFLLFKNLFVMDMRSLNGTTLNSAFLPYGPSKKLADDDIVTLAGIAPFQFSTSPKQMSRPSSAWAMVIDGKARTHHYLSSDHHVLALNPDGTIVVSEGGDGKGLLSIETRKTGTAIKDSEDGHDLRIEMKLGDYTYVSCKIPHGEFFNYFDVKKLNQYQPCEVLTGRNDLNDVTRFEHSLFAVTYKYGDTPFQLVPIIPDLEVTAPES